MDKEIKERNAKRGSKDMEFFHGADEFCGNSFKEEKNADSEIYRTKEFGGSGRRNCREQESFGKKMRRMLYVLASAGCAASMVITGTAQEERAIQTESVEEMETETAPTAQLAESETLAETAAEVIEEPADTLQLEPDEIEFLDSLWRAMESDDMGTVESMVLSPEYIPLSGKFQYEDVENKIFHEDNYV